MGGLIQGKTRHAKKRQRCERRFWPMRKFGTRNKKKCGKFLRKFILDVEIRPNVFRNDLINANYGNPGIQNAVNTIKA